MYEQKFVRSEAIDHFCDRVCFSPCGMFLVIKNSFEGLGCTLNGVCAFDGSSPDFTFLYKSTRGALTVTELKTREEQGEFPTPMERLIDGLTGSPAISPCNKLMALPMARDYDEQPNLLKLYSPKTGEEQGEFPTPMERLIGV